MVWRIEPSIEEGYDFGDGSAREPWSRCFVQAAA